MSNILEVLRRRSVWIPAVAAALALIVGYAVGYVTPILRAPGDSSAEAGFARDMSVHHNQAIHMAMLGYRKATTVTMTNLAYDIALTQTGQVGVMGQWLKEWGLQPTGDQEPMAWMPNGSAELKDGRMPGMATNEQLDQLDKATGKPFDILFCQLMLNHHLGGIHMVEGILKVTHNKDVRTMAEFMKRNQQAEVELLRDFLTNLGAQPLPS